MKQEESPVLSSILFGEGVLNDAVAIIIFRSISDFVFSRENGLT
jgi:NhaP-type Na+/H+ or K+/H+ antiporter